MGFLTYVRVPVSRLGVPKVQREAVLQYAVQGLVTKMSAFFKLEVLGVHITYSVPLWFSCSR